ncbi:MAG: beta galactosidase jelly roll domain-containing protein [Bacteroidetes bacterium]|nr:beta galactosidase jelly roll domain-containing protein [Bacteroidota bacterium]MDF1865276.1 sialate O-acetylesterase [Saprospiraceae bacterium]
MQKRIFLFNLLLICQISLWSQLSVSKLFCDHMVMQQDHEIPVWGWANANEVITVIFDKKNFPTKADKDGNWRVKLPAMKPGESHQMKIIGSKKEIEIKDIVVGDVWLCSGQSNMEWILKATLNADIEIPKSTDQMLRHFKVKRGGAQKPENKIPDGQWVTCSPETAPNFTAVGYYFGKELRQTQNIPIGLLNSSWGGSRIEAWMSAESLGYKNGQVMVEKMENDRKKVEQSRLMMLEKKFGEVPKSDKGIQNGKALWAASDFDDSNWNSMNLPGLWEDQGLKGIDGILWFRKEIELTAEQASSEALLGLAKIDDSDWTYINGEKIGESLGAWNMVRSYEIPDGVLKPGKNVITVRVEDTGGNGGFYGEPTSMFLKTENSNISLSTDWKYKMGEYRSAFRARLNQIPMMLYNKMLHPILDFPIKGVIWYQGESNAGGTDAIKYAEQFPTMIQDWRKRYGIGDFPFLYVQLANFRAAQKEPIDSDWAVLRASQTSTLKAIPNVAQAVIIDIGEADDIHPRNKHDVGHRLALGARKLAYGEDLVYSGPVFKSKTIEDNRIRIQFDHVGSGLVAKDKYGYLKGFAIAGENGQFVWAQAKIERNSVIVWNDTLQNPKHVRYGWADNPDDVNLYNKEDLPACPFRTDQ